MKDEFFEIISHCLEQKYQGLQGKHITLTLGAEEIQLIRLALGEYEKAPLVEMLTYLAQDACQTDLSKDKIDGFLKRASDQRESYQRMLTALYSKLENAMNGELERIKSRPGLN